MKLVKRLLFTLLIVSLISIGGYILSVNAEIIHVTEGGTSWGISEHRTFGDVYIVDSEATLANDTNAGTSRTLPLATIDGAINKCTADQGDIIYVLPGHAETVTSQINADVAGISIIGVGVADDRPTITVNAAIDGIDISATDIKIEGIVFAASTLTGVTSRINIDSTNAVIKNCLFIVGQYDTETITITASGDEALIEDNDFITNSAGTADAAIEIEADGTDGTAIIGNYFNGYDDTQAWDVGAVNSGNTPTNVRVLNNVSVFGPAIIFSSTAKGIIEGNYMAEGTIGAMLDPGSCMCAENYEADAIDESARLFPTTTPDGATTPAAALIATNLDHLASLDSGVAADDSLAALIVNGSFLAHIMDAGAAVADYDASTDSLQAIGDRMDTQNTADQVDIDAILADTGTAGVVIGAGAITSTTNATNCIGADEIADNAIDAGALAADCITSAEIANNAIGATEIADGAIDAGAIAADAITSAEIANDAIGATEIATDAIDADAIAANAIGAAELAGDCITNAELAADCIGATEIANDAIDATAIATDAIDADALAADALAEIQAEAEDAIEADDLDHFLKLDGATSVYPENCADDSILAKILSKSDPADISDYDCQTDSLEAIRDYMAAGTGVTVALDADDLDHLVSTSDGTAAYPASVASESILGYIMGIDGDPTDFDEATDSLEALGDQVTDANIEARVVAANLTDQLDHLAKTGDGTGQYPATVAQDSIIAMMLSASADPVATSYDNRYESLEALGNYVAGASINYHRPNDDTRGGYFIVTCDTATTTWNTQTTHEIITVTGAVRIRLAAQCTENIAGAGTLELGITGNTAGIIAQIADAENLDAGNIWHDATPDSALEVYSDTVKDIVIIDGTDIGYTVGTTPLTDGIIIFHVWWEPLDATGDCTAGAGGTL